MPQSIIADKVLRRVLPSDRPLRSWVACGNGRSCDGCGKPITTTEVRLELPGDTILRLHIACEGFWRSATGNDGAGCELPQP
jgi:hypothetical protein